MMPGDQEGRRKSRPRFQRNGAVIGGGDFQRQVKISPLG